MIHHHRCPASAASGCPAARRRRMISSDESKTGPARAGSPTATPKGRAVAAASTQAAPGGSGRMSKRAMR
jgi:hypothetical protein